MKTKLIFSALFAVFIALIAPPDSKAQFATGTLLTVTNIDSLVITDNATGYMWIKQGTPHKSKVLEVTLTRATGTGAGTVQPVGKTTANGTPRNMGSAYTITNTASQSTSFVLPTETYPYKYIGFYVSGATTVSLRIRSTLSTVD